MAKKRPYFEFSGIITRKNIESPVKRILRANTGEYVIKSIYQDLYRIESSQGNE